MVNCSDKQREKKRAEEEEEREEKGEEEDDLSDIIGVSYLATLFLFFLLLSRFLTFFPQA